MRRAQLGGAPHAPRHTLRHPRGAIDAATLRAAGAAALRGGLRAHVRFARSPSSDADDSANCTPGAVMIGARGSRGARARARGRAGGRAGGAAPKRTPRRPRLGGDGGERCGAVATPPLFPANRVDTTRRTQSYKAVGAARAARSVAARQEIETGMKKCTPQRCTRSQRPKEEGAKAQRGQPERADSNRERTRRGDRTTRRSLAVRGPSRRVQEEGGEEKATNRAGGGGG